MVLVVIVVITVVVYLRRSQAKPRDVVDREQETSVINLPPVVPDYSFDTESPTPGTATSMSQLSPVPQSAVFKTGIPPGRGPQALTASRYREASATEMTDNDRQKGLPLTRLSDRRRQITSQYPE